MLSFKSLLGFYYNENVKLQPTRTQLGVEGCWVLGLDVLRFRATVSGIGLEGLKKALKVQGFKQKLGASGSSNQFRGLFGLRM